MIPGSGISSKLPGYVPAKSISYGRRQVIKLQKKSYFHAYLLSLAWIN